MKKWNTFKKFSFSVKSPAAGILNNDPSNCLHENGVNDARGAQRLTESPGSSRREQNAARRQALHVNGGISHKLSVTQARYKNRYKKIKE